MPGLTLVCQEVGWLNRPWYRPAPCVIFLTAHSHGAEYQKPASYEFWTSSQSLANGEWPCSDSEDADQLCTWNMQMVQDKINSLLPSFGGGAEATASQDPILFSFVQDPEVNPSLPLSWLL